MTVRVLCHQDMGFIMVRKCCTTSLKWIVREAMALDHDQSLHTDKRLNYVALDGCESLKTVAIVRCPFRRLLSTWRNKMHDQKDHPGSDHMKALGVRPGCSFDEFVCTVGPLVEQEGHLLPQWQHLPARVDYMLRFEALEEQWPILQAQHNWVPNLPVRNASRYTHADWKDHYTPKLKAQVAAMYPQDLELWQAAVRRPAKSIEDVRWITS